MRKMTDEQRALAEKHLQLVTWVLNNRVPFWRRDEYDDMWQAGAIGLCKAAMLFDESVGVKFGTYAAVFIRGARSIRANAARGRPNRSATRGWRTSFCMTRELSR